MDTHQQVLKPLTFSYPSAAQLLPTFDVERLQADVASLDGQQWSLQRNYTTTGPDKYAAFDWRALPLCSPTGSPERTDPGGAGLDDFADTVWMQRAPYLAEIIRSIPAPLRSVRLLTLGVAAKSKVHFETKIRLPWANVRLHVPIITNPGATLMINGHTHQWQPGSFWFGDFSRWHQVANDGTEKRIHMVIDSNVTPELMELFPASFLAELSPHDVLYIQPEVPVADIKQYRCEFEIPTAFADWEEAEGQFLLPQPNLRASVDVHDGRLVLSVDGKPMFGTTHIGDGEFRFSGWTEERTIQILRVGDNPHVVLRTRQGTRVRRLEVPIAKPAGRR